jgi:hypothetical protein
MRVCCLPPFRQIKIKCELDLQIRAALLSTHWLRVGDQLGTGQDYGARTRVCCFMSAPGGVFYCSDCGITFASAALLNNHRQRFCNSSRVDLAAKLMLESGQAPRLGGRGVTNFPRVPMAQSAPSAQDQFNGSFPRDVYHRGASTPHPVTSGLVSSRPGSGGPRSQSVEPGGMYGGNREPPSGAYGGPSAFGGPMEPPRPSPGGPLAGAGALPPYMPPMYRGPELGPSTHAPLGAGQNDYLLRLVQEQQKQMAVMQQQMAAANQMRAYGGGGGGGGAAAAGGGGRQLIPGGNGIYNLTDQPLPRYGAAGEMTVVEGRYGIRIYAAEGLRAFYTLADGAPLDLRIRQVYCRRRVGYYLPELEQRDEWSFRNSREVAMNRRNGYINFGRCEYVFNVVSANEIIIVIELLCQGQLVAWTEVLIDSLGEKVRRLRHPPIDVASALRDFTLRATTATIGVEAFRARWDHMGFDGDEDDAPSPAPPPPPRPRTPEEPRPPPPPPEPTTVPNPCDVYVDGVEGVPLSQELTRVSVHLCQNQNDFGPAIAIMYQTESSSSYDPQFGGKVTVPLSETTLLVLVAESTNRSTREVLGHAIIPLPRNAPIGNYKARMFRGPPVPDHLLPEYDSPLEYPPCLFIRYRLHSSRPQQTYKQLEPPREEERTLQSERKVYPVSTPRSQRISAGDMPKIFQAARAAEADATRLRVYSLITYLAPYNARRGIAFVLHNLRGMPLTRTLYKVVIAVGSKTVYTREHDFKSDVGVPRFKDAVFVFPGVPYEQFGTATLSLYQLTIDRDEGPPTVELWAHTFVPLFVAGQNFARFGKWTLPWHEGPPDPAVANRLRRGPAKETINECLESRLLKALVPRCTVTYSLSDPLRVREFTETYETAPWPVRILFPDTNHDAYHHEVDRQGVPTKEGMHGKRLELVHGGERPQAYTARMNAALVAHVPQLQTA